MSDEIELVQPFTTEGMEITKHGQNYRIRLKVNQRQVGLLLQNRQLVFVTQSGNMAEIELE